MRILEWIASIQIKEFLFSLSLYLSLYGNATIAESTDFLLKPSFNEPKECSPRTIKNFLD